MKTTTLILIGLFMAGCGSPDGKHDDDGAVVIDTDAPGTSGTDGSDDTVGATNGGGSGHDGGNMGSCGECADVRTWCEGEVQVELRFGCTAGGCAVTDEVRTDCIEQGDVCSEGECVPDPMRDNDGPQYSCSTDCTARPAYCVGNLIRTPLGTATCDRSTGECRGETYDESSCADQGMICRNAECVSAPKRAFLTLGKFKGDLASYAPTDFGEDAADYLCQLEAEGAGFGGIWKAWLSSRYISATDRIAEVGGWHLVDNQTLVANSLAELASSGPRVPISMHPNGETLDEAFGVWTGTRPTGANSGATDCDVWTSSSYTDLGVFGVEHAGRDEVGDWTHWTDGDCGVRRHLYCFEQ